MTNTPETEQALVPCPWCRQPLTIRGGCNPYGRCDTEGCWMCERKATIPLHDKRQVDQWNHREQAQRTEPSAGEVERVEVKKIETVTGDFLTEPGAPFWRIELDGYCADFDYEEAANNFAAAIQAMRGGQGERVGVLVPGYTEAADAIERGDFLPGEGIHPARGV